MSPFAAKVLPGFSWLAGASTHITPLHSAVRMQAGGKLGLLLLPGIWTIWVMQVFRVCGR
jgi:hypothetical protein